jgi:hypothetical protein
MEAESPAKTLATLCHTTRRQIPEDSDLHSHCYESRESNTDTAKPTGAILQLFVENVQKNPFPTSQETVRFSQINVI